CPGQRVLGRRFVARVQRDAGDIAVPAEFGQPIRITCGGGDVVALGKQGGDEPGTYIAGSTGNQDPHSDHGTECALPKSAYQRFWRTSSSWIAPRRPRRPRGRHPGGERPCAGEGLIVERLAVRVAMELDEP